MTDRWLNVVLAIVVVVGLTAVAVHERPRAAEERAELLGQEVVQVDDDERDGPARDPLEGLGSRDDPPDEADLPDEADPDEADEADEAAETAGDDEPGVDAGLEEYGVDAGLEEYGVTAGHPLAVDVGMGVLEAGGNAVDAAIAVSYALGVVEPFGSGVGGGGAMVIYEPGEQPVGYDYREIAPQSGEIPTSDIGVPGFVAGMEHIHERHATMDLADLIEPAAVYAEDGFEVDDYLHDRLRAAGHRLPIHLAPRLFPGGAAIAPGETLRQPEYAEALRLIAEHGSEVMYGGELGQRIADEVSGLDIADFEAYEVLEVEPVVGSFAGYDIVGAGPPVSGLTIVQFLHIADALGVTELDPDSAEHHHAVAQAYRLALADRTEHVTDPSMEDVPVAGLLDRDYAAALAEHVPDDGFVPADSAEDVGITPESDTTQLVVVDRDGTMVSATNTLSNFFGSGLVVDGFFLNDQLKNFSRDADSVNTPAPGKRPRSFIAPMIVARDGAPVLGLGTPGGRRIPMIVGQVLVRWAGHGQSLDEAVAAPRTHLEGRELYVEQDLGDAMSTLAGYGYEIRTEAPVTEFYGGVQSLEVDHDAGTVGGFADERRAGDWASAS